MKAKRPYRIAFYRQDDSLILTAKVYSPSMRGAKMRAKNLEPFEWHRSSITDLSHPFNLAIDLIEFPN